MTSTELVEIHGHERTLRCGPEGIALRTPDRSVITKARFEDYDRTLRRKG
ncbi:hypothetical protein ACFYTS_25690 [Nocardia sp. NPDC004151]